MNTISIFKIIFKSKYFLNPFIIYQHRVHFHCYELSMNEHCLCLSSCKEMCEIKTDVCLLSSQEK